MGRRHPCCLKQKLRKGLWSPEEDEKLFEYIARFGVGCWSSVPKLAGLQRCGKSCRLRWINYLRPDLKRGLFSHQEEDLIINLHRLLGNRWAQIATQLPGRTDNEIKNFWNSSLKKKLIKQGIDPATHKPASEVRGLTNNDKKCTEKSAFMSKSDDVPTLSATELAFPVNEIGSGLSTDPSRDQFMSRTTIFNHHIPRFDDLTDCNSLLVPQYHDQGSFLMNTNLGYIDSMPGFADMCVAECSDNSASRISSSNSSNMNSNLGEKTCFSSSWDGENQNKVESLFQFQVHGMVKSEEEFRSGSWHEDFSSYQLTSLSEDPSCADFDVFHHI